MEFNWNHIVKDLTPRLANYFCASFSPETAADLTQETLMRVLVKVRSGEYRSEQATLSAFTYGVAHYVRLETIKALVKAPRPVADLEKHIPDPTCLEHGYRDRERARLLRVAIGNLSAGEQQVVLLLIDRDLTLDEIATILKLPLNTVKSHMHRAKQRLQDELRRVYESGT